MCYTARTVFLVFPKGIHERAEFRAQAPRLQDISGDGLQSGSSVVSDWTGRSRYKASPCHDGNYGASPDPLGYSLRALQLAAETLAGELNCASSALVLHLQPVARGEPRGWRPCGW